MNPLTTLLFTAFALLSPHMTMAQPAATQAGEESWLEHEPVLLVDGEPVSGAEYRSWLMRWRGKILATSFAKAWLVRREADRLGAGDVGARARERVEAEIQTRIHRVHGGDRSKWAEELALGNRSPQGRILERTLELETDELLRSIAARGRVVPHEKIEREWTLKYGRAGRRFDVRLLYKRLRVPSLPGATREERDRERVRVREELRTRMLSLRQRARGGDAFADLVRAHSEDGATRAAGGLAEGGLRTQGWPDAALESIAALQPGEVSEPLFVRGGYWLVQLERLTVMPLAAVEAELEQLLIERGPEADETGAVLERLWAGVDFEVLPAAFLQPEPGSTERSGDEPVLRIGDATVVRAEYARWLVQLQGEILARRFAEHWTLARMARVEGIAFSDDEVLRRVDADIERIIEFYFDGKRDKWQAQTLGRGRTLASYRRDTALRTRDDMVCEALIKRGRVITEDLLRSAWRKRYGPNGTSLDLRLIRIDAVPPEVPDASPEERTRLAEAALETARLKAEDVRGRVQDGEDFASLARRFSNDRASKDAGGTPADRFAYKHLPQEIVDAIEALDPGGVTAVQGVGASYFVFELVGRTVVPYPDVRDALSIELQQRRPTTVELAGYRNVLMRDTAVEVRPALFR